MALPLTVYLAGEIHSDWREQIITVAEREELPITFLAPVTDHPASDDVGVAILGDEPNSFWKDHKGGKINGIRARSCSPLVWRTVDRSRDKHGSTG